MSITDALGNATSFQYDAAGRKAKITRANGQVTTFDSYDAMNRPLQQTVKQTPDPDAVTKYTYYNFGLLKDFQDPHISSTSNKYTYGYDSMGRKTSLAYPSPTPGATPCSESWHFDTAGRNDTFTNRNGNVQTFSYDSLNRPTNISWNDGGVTPSVAFGYDAASRTTSITNANATISRAYLNDNLLSTEATTYADATARTVTYTYDADASRATLQYPNGAYGFTYAYTNRNQLQTITNTSGGSTVISYSYDLDGNLSTRTPNNSTSSTYSYDALDRATHISHGLVSGARTLDYAYDSVGNRKWTKRDSGTGDVFGYDLNDQVTATLLNVANPDTTSPGTQTIIYDANGNRTSFGAYGTTDTYTTNNLNQYAARNSNQAQYDPKGNMTTGLDGSTYSYDAQNRVLTATKNGATETFTYDGLNRQVTRKIGAASPVYNVYDGWDLIAEYNGGSTTPLTAYVNGAGGLVKLMTASSSYYYYQDASGSTSHLSDNTGHLVEWYRYDLQGTPVVYDSGNNLRTGGSAYGIRHLFTGQQWYSDVGLYDLRNRFYSPDSGRFLQPDPIGFAGDATHLYRYCGNNPIVHSDPQGKMAQWIIGAGVVIIVVAILVNSTFRPAMPVADAPPQPSSLDLNPQDIVYAATPNWDAPPTGSISAPSQEEMPFDEMPQRGTEPLPQTEASYQDVSVKWMTESGPSSNPSGFDPNAGFYGMPVTGAGPYMGGNQNSNNPGYVAPRATFSGPFSGDPSSMAVGGPPLPPQKYL